MPQVYTRELGHLVLPVSELAFQDAETAARRAALHSFEAQLLGRSQGAALSEQLNRAMNRERDIKATANVAQSNLVCQVRAAAATGCFAVCCRGLCPAVVWTSGAAWPGLLTAGAFVAA